MDLPTVEIVIRDGEPMFRVEGMGMVTEHRQLWQAQIRWECLRVARSGQPPALVEEDGGRFGEPGV